MEREAQPGYGLPARRAATGKAALFTLVSIDKTDHPGGSQCGRPGGPAIELLGCADTGADVDLAESFALESRFILYSIEDLSGVSPLLIFVEMPSTKVKERLIREEAFIDRGARMVAVLGSKVLVASLETAETFIKASALEAPIEAKEWNLSVIWNTGRCGSTLMHKALLAAGVGSFSEPQWLDQLCFTEAEKVDTDLLRRAFRVCWLLDIHLLRALPSFQAATMFSLNPKTSSWLRNVGGPISDAFPGLRHCFMYRACDKVAESFSSLDAATVPECKIQAANETWKQKGPSMLHPMMSGNLKPLVSNQEFPIASIESLGVARRVLSWLHCLDDWRTMQGSSENFAEAPVVRMDEFVTKDLVKREAVLAEVLVRLGVFESPRDPRIQAALEVFNENSQQNSAMGGVKKAGLSEKCRSSIFQCIKIAAPLISGVEVEGEGSNAILPGSLGTCAAKAVQPSLKKVRSD